VTSPDDYTRDLCSKHSPKKLEENWEEGKRQLLKVYALSGETLIVNVTGDASICRMAGEEYLHYVDLAAPRGLA